MLDKLAQIEEDGVRSLDEAQDEEAVEAWRVATLGRNSPLMRTFSELPQLSKENISKNFVFVVHNKPQTVRLTGQALPVRPRSHPGGGPGDPGG